MSSQTRTWLSANSGDLAMMYMTLVAGLNFVVVRDAVTTFSPLVFNVLRFGLAACFIVPILVYRIPKMQLPWRDFIRFTLVTTLTMTFMQYALVTALSYTTASNTSLMMATGPAWTVLLIVMLGKLKLNRYLLVGLGIMFTGTTLVILSGGGDVAFSSADLLGCGLMLLGTMAIAGYVVSIQGMVERHNSVDLSLIKHTSITVGMLVIASPELVHFKPSDVPLDLLPNILYGGLIATISGTMTSTYAQRKIGAARMKVYDNLMPVSATIFAFFILGEPLTLLQVLGGAMTLTGVMVVRRYAKQLPAVEAKPKPQSTPSGVAAMKPGS